MNSRPITRHSAASFAVAGPMTLASAGELQRAGYHAFADAAASFEVDLVAVDAADSAGLAVLIDWLAWAAAHQRQLRYHNMPAVLESLATLSEVREMVLSTAQPA